MSGSNVGLGAFSLGRVHKCDDAADQVVASPDGIGPNFNGKAGSVGSPKMFVFEVCGFALGNCPEPGTFLGRIGRSVWMAVMNQIMHSATKQILGLLITKHS